MNFDVILGVSIVLASYGLMWYLALKSGKVIENIDKKGPGHTEATKNEPRMKAVRKTAMDKMLDSLSKVGKHGLDAS